MNEFVPPQPDSNKAIPKPTLTTRKADKRRKEEGKEKGRKGESDKDRGRK